MATDWGPVVQTAIGAAAALGGGTLVARRQVHSQERMERDRRRERAGEVLAQVTALLADAEAIRVGGTILRGAASKETLVGAQGALVARHGALRGQLLALATGHPSPDVRNRARLLEAALGSYLHSIWWCFVNRLSDEQQRLNANAEDQHAKAVQLLAELLDRI